MPNIHYRPNFMCFVGQYALNYRVYCEILLQLRATNHKFDGLISDCQAHLDTFTQRCARTAGHDCAPLKTSLWQLLGTPTQRIKSYVSALRFVRLIYLSSVRMR